MFHKPPQVKEFKMWQSESDICQKAGTFSACYSTKQNKITYSTSKCIVTTAYIDQSNITTA